MRLFIGIAIPQGIRTQIYSQSLRMQEIASGKYVREDMYHITLAYIGECSDDMRGRAAACLRDTAGMFSPVLLAPGAPGYFGKPEKAILHLSVDGGSALEPVCNALRTALSAADLPFDPKPLVPHITLARNVGVSEELLKEKYEYAPFAAEGLTLFNSCRVDGLLSYIPLETAIFSGGA